MLSRAEYIEIGERLTMALMSGDFALYQGVMALPLRIVPLSGKAYTLATADRLREDFDLYHRNLKLHCVTDLVREVLDIVHPAEGEAAVTVRMEMLAGGQRIVEPWEMTQHLWRTPDGWRIYRIESSLGHIDWTLGRAAIRDGGFRARDEDA